jgi:hypothetical protein
MIGKLIMELFHARTTAHVLHLKSRSYAQHVALNTFYDEIIDLADTLAEAYQGEYSLIATYPAKYTPYDDPILLMDDLRECVDDCSKEFDAADTHLNNICDEIRTLIASTAYKLRFLK